MTLMQKFFKLKRLFASQCSTVTLILHITPGRVAFIVFLKKKNSHIKSYLNRTVTYYKL